MDFVHNSYFYKQFEFYNSNPSKVLTFSVLPFGESRALRCSLPIGIHPSPVTLSIFALPTKTVQINAKVDLHL